MCKGAKCRHEVCGHAVTYYYTRCNQPDCLEHLLFQCDSVLPGNCKYCQRYNVCGPSQADFRMDRMEAKFKALEGKVETKCKQFGNVRYLKGFEGCVVDGVVAPVK